MHTLAHKSTAQTMFGVAVLAGMAGALAALLIAPKSGRETRDEIRRKMNEAQERSRQRTADMKAAASDKAEELRDKTEQTAADIKDAAAEARDQVEDAVQENLATGRNRRRTTL